jgi:hypothetical protein
MGEMGCTGEAAQVQGHDIRREEYVRKSGRIHACIHINIHTCTAGGLLCSSGEVQAGHYMLRYKFEARFIWTGMHTEQRIDHAGKL